MNKTKIFGLLLVFLSLTLGSCDSKNEPVDPKLLVPVAPVVNTCAKPNAFTISNFSGNSVSASWTSSEGTAWEIQYGLDGFIPGTGTSVAATTNTATINGLTTTNNYDFYVRTNCGNGLFSDWTGPVGVGTSVVNCTSPTNFTALRSATDNTKANLLWSANGDEDSWEIQYGNAGFAVGSGTTVAVTDTPSKTITGLLATTGYDFYVRSICSPTENSGWVGPVHINPVP